MTRRVSETKGSDARDFYYSSGWQVLEERLNGTTDTRYVWSPVYVDAMILRDRDTDGNGSLDERLYVIQDANWNVTALVNATGTVVERIAFDSFGLATVYDASWSVRSGGSNYGWLYLHQGGRWEGATGLYQFRNREYSATFGRWLQVDPIGFSAGDLNLYRGVANTPVSARDPFGTKTITRDTADRHTGCDCPCKTPADCEIQMVKLKSGDVFVSNVLQTDGKTKPVPSKVKENFAEIVNGKANYYQKFDVLLEIVSKKGEDVSGCHLTQRIVDEWYLYVDGKIEQNDRDEQDYHPNLPFDFDWYGGWWLIDTAGPAGNQVDMNKALTKGFMQFRDFITEAPAVSVYWGLQVWIDWSSDILKTKQSESFGVSQKAYRNPYNMGE
jgi:RHS repeat-associated protein